MKQIPQFCLEGERFFFIKIALKCRDIYQMTFNSHHIPCVCFPFGQMQSMQSICSLSAGYLFKKNSTTERSSQVKILVKYIRELPSYLKTLRAFILWV